MNYCLAITKLRTISTRLSRFVVPEKVKIKVTTARYLTESARPGTERELSSLSPLSTETLVQEFLAAGLKYC